MEKLMTKFDYKVEEKPEGCYITVTRLADSAVKIFYLAYAHGAGAVSSLCYFMDSITDELAEGYFPKPRKVK